MKWKMFTTLLIGACLVAYTIPDLTEARGRGGRGGGFSRGGGGGFSRGGSGGFSRGVGRGNFGSIRNSARPSTREVSRPSRDNWNRPAQGGLWEGQSQKVQDRASNLTPDQKQALQDRAYSLTPEQKQSLQNKAANLTPEQKQQIQDRAASLTPEQKEELRQKYEDSGLTPGQLPNENPDREDWQEWRDQNREDWQEWYDDQYDDYWDHHYHHGWWYGYPVSTVSYSFYIDNTPPCTQTVVINQATGSTTYYHCNSVWYQPAYADGQVRYVVTSPPAGGELTTLSNPSKMTVNGQDYFLGNHIFYQKITRDGQTLYVTVDAPIGAMVPTIPQYAVEIKHQDQTYYRFDKIFYQREKSYFVVVANPGV